MLEIRDLVKVYPGPVAALQGIRLELPQGMFGLLGPNGSGKTTLMRILAGLLEPTSGQVRFDGIDVVAKPHLLWPRLGYLPQDFGFYPSLTGEAMLLHLLRLKGVRAPGGLKKLARELLERVNLGFAARRKVKAYSGGMRQRLGIAQALAGEPDLLIVDEPTAGLDPEERLRLYRLLVELADDRVVLLSTHNVNDVATLCSRFAVLQGGRVLADTTPAAARSALAGRLCEGEVERDQLEALGRDYQITRTDVVEGRERIRLFHPGRPAPPRFRAAEPTLEDAYFVLTHTAAADPDSADPRAADPRAGDPRASGATA